MQALSVAASDAEASEAVLRLLAGTLNSPLAVLWLLDEPSALLRWAHSWTGDSDADALDRIGRRLTFAPGVGLPGRVIESLQPEFVEQIASDPGFPRAEIAARAGMRCALGFPLLSSAGATGVMEFFAREPQTPSDQEIDGAMLAGRQLAAYLEHSRVEDRLRASEESSASIIRAALDCIVTMDHRGRVLDFNPAAERTFGYARETAVGAKLADLIIPPDLRAAHERALGRYVEHGTTTILGQRLELSGLRADGSEFPIELTVTRIGSREPPVFAGFIRDISERRVHETEQTGLLRDALLARAQSEAAGVRTDDAREEAERARTEAERGHERIAFLAQASRSLAESMDWETTLSAVVRSAVPAMADWSELTVVLPGGRLKTLAIAHANPEHERLAWELAERYPPDPERPTGSAQVIRGGEVEVLRDVSPDVLRAAARDDEHLRLLTALNINHRVIAPLMSPEGVIGALSFVLGDSRRALSDVDVELFTSLAARAALQIQNARLYTERSHIAQTLQASLRPRALPAIPGAEIAARFLPAGDQNEVGGDFYDVFPSGDGVWTAIVGDVAGKGPEAAAVTALVRHTLRAASMLYDDPAASLALLDRALQAEIGPLRFCTVFYAHMRPAGDAIEFDFANGGHPGPLVLGPGGAVERVDAGRGPLVGGLPDAQFTRARLRLGPGELLLMYTDGVTEVRKSDPDLGEQELLATLAAHAGADVDEIVAAVARRAVELQQGDQRDDIALLAIRAVATLPA